MTLVTRIFFPTFLWSKDTPTKEEGVETPAWVNKLMEGLENLNNNVQKLRKPNQQEQEQEQEQEQDIVTLPLPQANPHQQEQEQEQDEEQEQEQEQEKETEAKPLQRLLKFLL